MIEIDGAEQSGSGTLVRVSVGLAALLGEPLRVVNARARRPRPGLRPQHVAAVRACAELCGATLEGVEVGAGRFAFHPGGAVRGGRFAWEIGTAGSTTMLALGILPLACLAAGPTRARIRGGVFQDLAPSPDHLQQVLAPLLARMGAQVEVRVVRPGYVPGGEGEIEVSVEPARTALAALELLEAGAVHAAAGVARASHLAERRVAERMAETCAAHLAASGIDARIEREDDRGARHPGACLAVWAESTSGARFGADRAGARGRSAESIGRFVARRLLDDLRSGATTDRHLADQLVPFAALAAGVSAWRAPAETEHLVANLWLVERFGARARVEAGLVRIEGLGVPSQGRGGGARTGRAAPGRSYR